MGVMGFGPSIIRGVRVKELSAPGAAMLGVNEVNVTGPTGNQIPDVMQDAGEHTVPKTGLITEWTRTLSEIATAPNDLRFG